MSRNSAIVGVTFALFFFGMAFDSGISPVITDVAQSLGVSAGAVIGAVSAFNWLFVLGILIGNVLAPYVSFRIATSAIGAMTLLFGFAAYYAPTFQPFMASWGALGFLAGYTTVVYA